MLFTSRRRSRSASVLAATHRVVIVGAILAVGAILVATIASVSLVVFGLHLSNYLFFLKIFIKNYFIIIYSIIN